MQSLRVTDGCSGRRRRGGGGGALPALPAARRRGGSRAHASPIAYPAGRKPLIACLLCGQDTCNTPQKLLGGSQKLLGGLLSRQLARGAQRAQQRGLYFQASSVQKRASLAAGVQVGQLADSSSIPAKLIVLSWSRASSHLALQPPSTHPSLAINPTALVLAMAAPGDGNAATLANLVFAAEKSFAAATSGGPASVPSGLDGRVTSAQSALLQLHSLLSVTAGAGAPASRHQADRLLQQCTSRLHKLTVQRSEDR